MDNQLIFHFAELAVSPMCTKCCTSFSTMSDLHCHIIQCATSNKQTQKIDNNKTSETSVVKTELNHTSYTTATHVAENDANSEEEEDNFRRKRSRNSELLYNPLNHVRRREMIEVLDVQTCGGCLRKFDTISLLERHVPTCHNKDKIMELVGSYDGPEKITSVKPVTSLYDRLQCRYCLKNFTYMGSIRKHIRSVCSVRKRLLATSATDKLHNDWEQTVLYSDDAATISLAEKFDTPKRQRRKGKRKNHHWGNTKKRKFNCEEEVRELHGWCGNIEQGIAIRHIVTPVLDTPDGDGDDGDQIIVDNELNEHDSSINTNDQAACEVIIIDTTSSDCDVKICSTIKDNSEPQSRDKITCSVDQLKDNTVHPAAILNARMKLVKGEEELSSKDYLTEIVDKIPDTSTVKAVPVDGMVSPVNVATTTKNVRVAPVNRMAAPGNGATALENATDEPVDILTTPVKMTVASVNVTATHGNMTAPVDMMADQILPIKIDKIDSIVLNADGVVITEMKNVNNKVLNECEGNKQHVLVEGSKLLLSETCDNGSNQFIKDINSGSSTVDKTQSVVTSVNSCKVPELVLDTIDNGNNVKFKLFDKSIDNNNNSTLKLESTNVGSDVGSEVGSNVTTGTKPEKSTDIKLVATVNATETVSRDITAHIALSKRSRKRKVSEEAHTSGVKTRESPGQQKSTIGTCLKPISIIRTRRSAAQEKVAIQQVTNNQKKSSKSPRKSANKTHDKVIGTRSQQRMLRELRK